MSAAVQFREGDVNRSDAAQGMEVLGRVVSSVAHDFNNLITGVLLYSDLLSKELPPDSRLQRHVSGIRRAGEHGAALIQQLLSVARPQTNDLDLLSVGLAITEMRDLLARLAGENIELVLDEEPGIGRVRMSAPQFHRILLNLVLNARDAMPDGGHITLKTRAAGVPASPEIELTVTDTGCGMDDATKACLFQPFFTTKTLGNGTGLGLFTVHNIVSQSGGTLLVESAPQKGTHIKVCLPAITAKQMAIQVPEGNNRKKR